MYRVSIEFLKHEKKFGRTTKAVGTRAASQCFHSFFEFSKTFTSVSIKQLDYEFDREFYHAIVDEGAARVNYHA